jgi:hypothetical protein
MTIPPCVYRDLSDDAYRVDAVTGAEKRIEVWLCTWPTTLGAKPPWVESIIGKGLAITPATACPACPVRVAAAPTPSGEEKK